MRTLTDTLKAAQQTGALNPLYKIVLTKGESSYTYEKDRILPSKHDEEMYSHLAEIVLNNADGELDDIDLKGYDAVISYGFASEYSATASLSVLDQQFDSDPNKLTCTLFLEGIPNLMAEDEASESYLPEADNSDTVKILIDALAGASLTPFTHCHAYDVVWDDGYDALADSYKPKDNLRIYKGNSRLAIFRKVLDYTGNIPRFEDDGKIHILKPVTSGSTFDAEYSLERGSHHFFSKAYRNTLVRPNRFVVESQPDDDPQYSGEAQIDGYDSLPAKVKKTKFFQTRLESDDQADSIAEALKAKAEMGSARGQAKAPINVGAEAFDYVQVIDSRQGDTRTGNLGYIHRRFGKDTWEMTFGFGNWLSALRYQKILKELETYTDAGSYFSRLQVGDLYAEHILADNIDLVWIDPDGTIDLSKIGDTLDNLPDGEVFARVKSIHISAEGGIKLDENILYSAGYDPSTKWTGSDLDDLPDGSVYQRTKSAALSAAGMVLLDQVEVGTYGLVYSADISAHHIKLSKCYGDLDDIDEGSTYGKLKLTDMDAGHLKLSSYTKVSGEWYDEGGVELDANYGMNIYGQNNALTTRATKTGAIQCYVGADGAIYAGGGDVKLSSSGIDIYGEAMRFFYGGTRKGGAEANSYGVLFGSETGHNLTLGIGSMGILSGITITAPNLPIRFLGTRVDMTNVERMVAPRKSSHPSSPDLGTMYRNTSDGELYIYTNAASGTRWYRCSLVAV